MAARTGIFAAQTSRVWRGRTWRFVLLLFMLVMAMGYVQTCLAFWGHDAAELPSAATAWIGNHAVMQTPVFGLFAYFLMVPCSSAIFADSLLLDVRSRRANALAARSSERGYVISSAALAFASAFAIVLAALLLSQALAYLAFPPQPPRTPFPPASTRRRRMPRPRCLAPTASSSGSLGQRTAPSSTSSWLFTRPFGPALWRLWPLRFRFT